MVAKRHSTHPITAASAGTHVPLQTGGSRCSNGTCELAECELNYGDCDGRPDNGCERMLTTLSDCGSCGAKCRTANAVTSCDDRECRFSSCSPGYGDCNGDAAKLDTGDGCETK